MMLRRNNLGKKMHLVCKGLQFSPRKVLTYFYISASYAQVQYKAVHVSIRRQISPHHDQEILSVCL